MFEDKTIPKHERETMKFELFCKEKNIVLTPTQKNVASYLMTGIRFNKEAYDFFMNRGTGVSTLLKLMEYYYKDRAISRSDSSYNQVEPRTAAGSLD